MPMDSPACVETTHDAGDVNCVCKICSVAGDSLLAGTVELQVHQFHLRNTYSGRKRCGHLFACFKQSTLVRGVP